MIEIVINGEENFYERNDLEALNSSYFNSQLSGTYKKEKITIEDENIASNSVYHLIGYMKDPQMYLNNLTYLQIVKVAAIQFGLPKNFPLSHKNYYIIEPGEDVKLFTSEDEAILKFVSIAIRHIGYGLKKLMLIEDVAEGYDLEEEAIYEALSTEIALKFSPKEILAYAIKLAESSRDPDTKFSTINDNLRFEYSDGESLIFVYLTNVTPEIASDKRLSEIDDLIMEIFPNYLDAIDDEETVYH
jgi:hypothetical protein